jgi:demethylmenaquinone methyltransferase/2-methoxy-6-polyprenyl-1,4-benzoquinol methylase
MCAGILKPALWLASLSGDGQLSAMPVSQWEEQETEAAVAAAATEGGDTKRVYVRRIFSQIAPRYDLLNHLLSFNIDKAWRRRAIAALDWERSPTGTYVDLCAGTLDVAAELSRQQGFRGHVVGADFAEPMLRAGLGKVSLAIVGPVVADALELPLRDASVAGATVAFGIRNVADLDVALREVRRVLEPEARFVILEFTTPRSAIVRALYHLYFHLVILEFTTPRSAIVRALYHLYFHRILPRIGAAISGHATAYRYLPRSVAHFPAEEELAARMRAAGFVDVRWQSLTFGIAAIHSGTKR